MENEIRGYLRAPICHFESKWAFDLWAMAVYRLMESNAASDTSPYFGAIGWFDNAIPIAAQLKLTDFKNDHLFSTLAEMLVGLWPATVLAKEKTRGIVIWFAAHDDLARGREKGVISARHELSEGCKAFTTLSNIIRRKNASKERKNMFGNSRVKFRENFGNFQRILMKV